MAPPSIPSGAFEGLKVADFAWMGVGPIVSMFLADHGATVVHVESLTRPDPLRVGPPFRDNQPGIDRSGYMPAFNANKLGISLNLKHPKALEVASRLIRWADVVTESMTPGVMSALGLGWERVQHINPSAIMYSTSQMGQDGPRSSYSGAGTQAAGFAGYTALTGWPDREPAGLFSAYTDVIAPWFLYVALVAALDYRRRTGVALYIDQSQYEAALSFLGPALLDYTVNGRIAGRKGNDDPTASPHGVYPCAGVDRWIAIAVRDQAEWLGLCRALGRDDWAADEQLGSVIARRSRRADLDDGIARWTAQNDAHAAMALFQEHGVPAGVAQTCEQLFADPQLMAREHFWFLDHAAIGKHAYQAPAFKLSETPAHPARAAPTLGQHNLEIYRDLLGYSEAAITELVIEGVLE